MIKLIKLFIVLVLIAPPLQANPIFGSRIVAKVNGSIVTAGDVIDRMQLIIASNKIKDSFELRQKILPMVMKGLIDEKIQIQAAASESIRVREEEITNAKLRMVNSADVTPDTVDDFFKEKGVPINSLEQQIRAGVSWGKYVGIKYRESDFREAEDVENIIARLSKEEGVQQKHLYEMFSFDSNELEEKRKNIKNNFVQTSKEVSKTPSASRGGEIGWVRLEDLEKHLKEASKDLSEKEVSSVIKSDEGYHVLFVQGMRTLELPDEDKREEWRQSLEEALRKKNLTALSKHLMNKHRRNVHLEVKF